MRSAATPPSRSHLSPLSFSADHIHSHHLHHPHQNQHDTSFDDSYYAYPNEETTPTSARSTSSILSVSLSASGSSSHIQGAENALGNTTLDSSSSTSSLPLVAPLLTPLPHPPSSPYTATLHFIVAAAGAGLLSFPFAVKSQGIIVVLVLTFIFAYLNYYTLTVIARYTFANIKHLPNASNESLITVVSGLNAGLFVSVTIIIAQLGAMIGFTLIISDYTRQVLIYICNLYSGYAGYSVCLDFTNHYIIVLILCLCFLLPLALLPSLHELSISSLVAVLSVISVMFIVIYSSIDNIVNHGTNSNNTPILLVNFSSSIILGLTIIIFSIGNQTQAVPILVELNFLHHNVRTTNKIFFVATTVCIIIYLFTGIFGYIQFTSNTAGNILDNYSISDILPTISKGIMALHVILAFPILLYPCKSSINYLLLRYYNIRETWLILLLQSIIIIFIVGLLAAVAPQIQVVFGLLGATTSVVQMYCVPALLLLSNKEDKSERQKGVALIVLSIVIGIIGTTEVIYSLVT